MHMFKQCIFIRKRKVDHSTSHKENSEAFEKMWCYLEDDENKIGGKIRSKEVLQRVGMERK